MRRIANLEEDCSITRSVELESKTDFTGNRPKRKPLKLIQNIIIPSKSLLNGSLELTLLETDLGEDFEID